MSKAECEGEELGDHSEPVVFEKDKGGIYNWFDLRDQGERGIWDWLVEGVTIFVTGGEEEAIGEVLKRLDFGCDSWV